MTNYGKQLEERSSAVFSLRVLGTAQPVGTIVFGETCRIAREALLNAFQHSNASKIDVELTYDIRCLCLRIRDNGIGIDQRIRISGRSGHWGLSGMRERAEKVGAKFSIRSNPGAGTEVEFTVPAKVAYPHKKSYSLWRRIKLIAGPPQSNSD